LTAAPGAGTNFQPDTYVSGANSSTYGVRDSLNGYNWAFTPPHQHGESWADLIFRPSGNVDYDLERILQETQVVRWRHDPGPRIGLQRPSEGKWQHSLVSDSPPLASGDPPLLPNYGIYNSHNTNHNAMQLDDSVNLFGVENIYRQRTDKFGKVISNENEVVGKRWVIQPKFETPMLNFADVGLHPITGSGNTKTLPANFGDDAAANGMWHQFGIMPEDNSKGIFLEIDDIPAAWLQHHYSVVSESSTYNNSSPDPSLYKNMKSFSSLLGFGQDNSKVRLGDIAPKQTIKEAVVAVPYVIENSLVDPKTTASDKNYELKKFINIPKTRYDAALSEAEGSAMGDSLDAAGASIRQLVDKMGQYVLPEQLDFVQNPLIEPIVMYIFEFKYDLDQNDLSYIWQNLAPRQYKKMFFQTEAVAHELFNTELLTEQNIMENPNLRWMVFKVKQKSQASYEDIIVRQASSATSGIKIDNRQIPPARPTTGYPIRYNWPYDYVSIVELAKIEAEVLYKKKTTSLMNTQNQEVNTASGKLSTINTALRRSTRALTPAVAPTVATETAKVEEKKIQSMIKEKTVEESAATAVKQSQAREASYNANLEKQKSARSTKMKGLRQTLDSFKQTSKPATKSKNRSKSPPPNTRKKKY
jgi:hypothetical protein